MSNVRYTHPDEAVRHLFRLYLDRGVVKAQNTHPVRVADRCKHCGGGPKVRQGKKLVENPRPGVVGHWSDVCFDCQRPWEGVPWHAVASKRERISKDHLLDDNGRCVFCELEGDDLKKFRGVCIHAGLTVRPTQPAPFVINANAFDARDLLLTLDLAVRQLDIWQWRIYGILHVGLNVGSRRDVGLAARKRWRHIPRHHTTERGVRTQIHNGRLALMQELRRRGLADREIRISEEM